MFCFGYSSAEAQVMYLQLTWVQTPVKADLVTCYFLHTFIDKNLLNAPLNNWILYNGPQRVEHFVPFNFNHEGCIYFTTFGETFSRGHVYQPVLTYWL